MPTGFIPVQAQVNQLAGIISAVVNTSIEPDVNDPEIVVIGQKLESIITTDFVISALIGVPFNLACVGTVSRSEIVMSLYNLRINATKQIFGPGRAGENLVGAGGVNRSEVLVNINVDSLKGYDALTGGLEYLVLHEIAHALPAMQTYDQQMWEAYIAGPGNGLTPAQQRANYYLSAQFAQNEARANSVARSLQQLLGRPAPGFTPTHGYANC